MGTSKSGLPEYTWIYIKDENKTDPQRYHGTMAQDLLALGRGDAVLTTDDGMYAVNYSLLDVAFYKVL